MQVITMMIMNMIMFSDPNDFMHLIAMIIYAKMNIFSDHNTYTFHVDDLIWLQTL